MRKKNNRGAVRLAIITGLLLIAAVFISAGRSHPNRVLNVEYIEIDLRGKEIRPVVFRSGALFSSVIEQYHPYAAINGTYYDGEFRPLGDILVGGKLENHGHYRNAVAHTNDGKLIFLHKEKGRLNWNNCQSGIAAGPRLIHNGKIALDPVSDGFSRRSLTIEALRSGVGRTRSGKLLLVTSKEQMTLAAFAQSMLDLGAVEAMNLDGGGASGLYFNGKTLMSPTLPMTNMLLVLKNQH